jgi:hypothetical protein
LNSACGNFLLSPWVRERTFRIVDFGIGLVRPLAFDGGNRLVHYCYRFIPGGLAIASGIDTVSSRTRDQNALETKRFFGFVLLKFYLR